MALTVKFRGDATQLEKTLASVQSKVGSLGKGAVALGATLAGVAVAGGAFAAKLGLMAEDGVAAEERMKHVVKQMGLFGEAAPNVAKRLTELADAQELATGADGDAIMSAQTKLATFKEVAKTANQMGGTFDRATKAAIDLAAAGFGSAESNATQLGKALQDPLKGLTALTKSGVTFTAMERDKIKALVQGGESLKAQDVILKAIEKQVGGTAEASAKGSDRIKAAFGQLADQIGGPVAASFKGFADGFVAQMPAMLGSMDTLGTGLAERAKVFGKGTGEVLGVAIADALAGDGQVFTAAGELLMEYLKAGMKTGAEKLWTDLGTGVANMFGAGMKNESFGEIFQRNQGGIDSAREQLTESTRNAKHDQTDKAETERQELLKANQRMTEELIKSTGATKENHKELMKALQANLNKPMVSR